MNPQIQNLQLVIEALEDKNYQLEMVIHFVTILFLAAVLVMLFVIMQYNLLKHKNRLLQMHVEAAEKTNKAMFDRYIKEPKFPNDRIEKHN